ncbi:MAG: hypothetical protein K2X37_12210, partial [Chitinophagaceae bacterium]|nr:hypothetical protein [Chitinophagaceae bacterium]
LSSSCFSQINERALFLWDAGVSVPVGVFAKKSITDLNSGFAQVGLSANFSYHIRIKKNHYFSFKTGINSNNFNSNSLTSSLQAQSNSNSYSTSTGRWSNINICIGGTDLYRLNKSNTIQLINSAYLGVSFVQSPNIIITQKNNSSGMQTTSNQASSKATAFVWSIDLGLRYNYSPKITFIFLSSYQSVRPTFRNIPITNSSGSNSNTSFSQSMSLLHFSFVTKINLFSRS